MNYTIREIEKRDDKESEKSRKRWEEKQNVGSFFHMVTPDTGTVLLCRLSAQLHPDL